MITILASAINSNKKENESETTNSNIDTRERDDTTYVRPDIISPMQKEKVFNSYVGQFDEEKVLESLTEFVYYIVDNKEKISNMNDEDISNEYSNNKVKYEKIGILTLESYVEIINTIKKIEGKNVELSYTQFDVNTIERINNGIVMKFNIKFVGINEISFKLTLFNKSINDNVLRIDEFK